MERSEMKNDELFNCGLIRVTKSAVRTPRLTVALEDVDLVELRRPLFGPALLLAIASSTLALRFGDVLLPEEIAAMAGMGWAGAVIGSCVARLTLHSYSIDDVALLLPIWRAKRVRHAIEQALASRARRNKPKHRHKL